MREIRYYQSEATAEAFLLPQAAFVRLVKEICDQVASHKDYRWQRDAVVAMQLVAEQVLVMNFEMT